MILLIKKKKEKEKNRMAVGKKQCFFAFLYWTESSSIVIQIPGFKNDLKFCIIVNKHQ